MLPISPKNERAIEEYLFAFRLRYIVLDGSSQSEENSGKQGHPTSEIENPKRIAA
jgi:hypothetical protein